MDVMSATRQRAPAMRKRRRFPSAFGQASGTRYARTYDLTAEAGDFLAALYLCDKHDLASALLVVHAMADVSEANVGGSTSDQIKERLAALRRWAEKGGGAPKLWQTIACDVKGRCLDC